MFITIIILIALALLGYVLRWNFRRFWHVLYTGDMEHDWEKLGADYFIAPWEKRRFAQKKAAKTSGRPLPIIIDTPLARLDSDHRKLLAQHYFPFASHQVLILSTDTEVDQSYFEELRGSVGQAYRLDFDPEENGTKIAPGYFWRHAHENN